MLWCLYMFIHKFSYIHGHVDMSLTLFVCMWGYVWKQKGTNQWIFRYKTHVSLESNYKTNLIVWYLSIYLYVIYRYIWDIYIYIPYISRYIYIYIWASPVAQMVKNVHEMQETWIWSLGWDDPLEKGMETHSNFLAWRIPWTEDPGGLQSVGLQRVGHKLVAHLCSFAQCLITPNIIFYNESCWTCPLELP